MLLECVIRAETDCSAYSPVAAERHFATFLAAPDKIFPCGVQLPNTPFDNSIQWQESLLLLKVLMMTTAQSILLNFMPLLRIIIKTVAKKDASACLCSKFDRFCE